MTDESTTQGVPFYRRGVAENRNPDQVEAGRERDRAETRKRQADVAGTAGEDRNREMVERESKLGAGPAGLNQGPSNTYDADPHNPQQRGPLRGSAPDPRNDGMGLSPNQGPQPTSDRPQYSRPIEERARELGEDRDPKAQQIAEQARDERHDAREQGREARGDLREAEKKIADQQSPGPGSAPRPQGEPYDPNRNRSQQYGEDQRTDRHPDGSNRDRS